MKPKKQYKKLSHEAVVAMVKAYHIDGRSQAELAREVGMASTYVCLLVHGGARREAFLEVFPDQR